MKEIRKTAFINSFLTTLYIVAVGIFFYLGATFKIGQNNNFIAPIAFLLLFVFSASITGYLMVGKSAQMYVDGKKKEALSLISYTLGFFFLFTLIGIILLILVPR